jgi:hypothetical protein
MMVHEAGKDSALAPFDLGTILGKLFITARKTSFESIGATVELLPAILVQFFLILLEARVDAP